MNNIEKLAIEAGFTPHSNGDLYIAESKSIKEALTKFAQAYARSTLQTKPVTEARVKELEALSVTNIMINVVPGFDGMGEEVYAKSVADVEKIINEMSIKLDAYEHNTFPPSTVPVEKYNKLLDALKFYASTYGYSSSWESSNKQHKMEDKGKVARQAIAEAEGKEG